MHEHGGKDWANLPNGIVKLHPYCRRCGTFKNVSSDRGKSIGFFVAVLYKLKSYLGKRGYKISEAQIRLITKELEKMEDFNDLWWITFSKQKDIFIDVVRKYVKVSKDILENFLYE